MLSAREIAAEHPELTWQFVLSRVDAPNFPVNQGERMVIIPFIP